MEGELAGLGFADVAQHESRWAIVDLVGKHGRIRTVPMPSWAKDALDRWAAAAGISSGAVLRRVDKAGRVGHGPITRRGSSRRSFPTPVWPASARSQRMIYGEPSPSSPTSGLFAGGGEILR